MNRNFGLSSGIAILVTCATILGCAQTAEPLLRQGEQHRYNLTKKPGAAADCIARNAESLRPPVHAEAVSLANGNAEVTIRGEAQQHLAYFYIEPEGAGTVAGAFVSYDLKTDRRGYSGSLVKGC